MKVFYPFYYKKFKCIAEKCKHSCCIGWEIAVDEETLKKYEKLEDKAEILCNIEGDVIRLRDDGLCPFLDSNGLCKIISRYGDEYTSVICREHPRFYHRVGSRVEGGIGASCEEACRLILSSDMYANYVSGEWQGEIADETDFDSLSHRDYIYTLISNEKLSFEEKIAEIKEKYGISKDIHSSDDWAGIFEQLEYLDDSHRGIFLPGEGREEHQKIYERFLAYLVFRHLSIAENHDNLRARLGFCLLLCSLLEGYTSRETVDFSDICDYVRIISEEIEYSQDNTDQLIFEFEANLD